MPVVFVRFLELTAQGKVSGGIANPRHGDQRRSLNRLRCAGMLYRLLF